MGDIRDKEGPAFSATWATRALIVLAVAAAFGLGWLAASGNADLGTPVNPAHSSTPPRVTAPGVRLELDAGSLTLMPDGGLHLPPLPSVDPDALYRESLDAGLPTERERSPRTK